LDVLLEVELVVCEFDVLVDVEELLPNELVLVVDNVPVVLDTLDCVLAVLLELVLLDLVLMVDVLLKVVLVVVLLDDVLRDEDVEKPKGVERVDVVVLVCVFEVLVDVVVVVCEFDVLVELVVVD